MKTPRNYAPVSRELTLWSTLAILLAIWSAIIVRNTPRIIASNTGGAGDRSPDRRYSWIGDDYPAYYPMEVLDTIMFPEYTMHYPINGDDAQEQWESQFPAPGEGWVCLGPERRPFALTMYHELHCLGRLRIALEDIANRTYEVQAEHVQHCLNYLRMMALCRADVTLEPVIDASLAVDLMQPHLCKDWVQVYSEASRNVAEQCTKGRA